MKICIVITSLDYGGAESLLVNSLNLLIKNNEIHVVYFKGTGKLIPQLNSAIKIYHIPYNFSCLFRLRKFLKNLDPEVLHTHVGHADIIGLLAATGLEMKKFSTIHNIRYTWNYVDYIYYFLYRLTFNIWARRCIVIGASKVVSNHISTRLKVKKKNIVVLYNAINDSSLLIDKSEARKIIGQKNDNFIFLFLGRNERIKSIDTLIKATQLTKNKIFNLSVEIIGEGTEQETLKKLAEELNVNDVITFRGGVPAKEAYYCSADVFVLPSVSEAFPTVILESFRAGLPVITTRLETIKEIVSENENGLMFEVKDYNELAEKMLEIWEDSARRTRFSINALQTFKEKYHLEVYINKLTELYQSK